MLAQYTAQPGVLAVSEGWALLASVVSNMSSREDVLSAGIGRIDSHVDEMVRDLVEHRHAGDSGIYPFLAALLYDGTWGCLASVRLVSECALAFSVRRGGLDLDFLR